MEHRLGQIDLVSWQGRGGRRLKAKAGVSPWTVVLVISAPLSVAAITGQVAGWLPSTGPLAFAPAGVVLLAACALVVTIARAVIGWLAG